MSLTNTPQDYRRNVAIVVLNEHGQILACQRSDVRGAWQLPQGGIDQDEDELSAMYRELEEEIGTQAVELIGRLSETIRYEWPESLYYRGYRGQEQAYFLVRLKPEAELDLCTHHTQEFDAVEWLGASQFLELVQGFKKQAYETAIKGLERQFPNLIKP